MPWSRMRFREQLVWVRVDDDARPVLDTDGRAEMKYKESDPRSYRPAPGNLIPVEGGEVLPSMPASSDRASAPRARGTTKGPRAPRSGSAPTPSSDSIAVWTDGACSGNPGPMGIGMVVLRGDDRLERGEYLGVGTNNIAELVAIERGLALAETWDPGLVSPLFVYTDSAYSIGVVSQGWKAKANQDLVARLRARVGAVANIHFVKVAGHAGVPENERCDELARAAIARRGTV